MPEITPVAPAPKVAALLVTSENRAEFMTKRMDLKATPEAAPVVVAPAPEVKVSTPNPEVKAPPAEEVKTLEADLKAEEAKAQPDEKKKQGIRERISEINEQKKVAQEETRQAIARAEKAEKEAADLRARAAPPPPPPAADELKAPARAEFTTEEAYQDARVDYRVKIARAEERKAEAEARAKAEGDRVVSTYTERLSAAKKEIPDFDERINKNKDLMIPPHIRDAIFESEVGPRIALHFADHPGEADRLRGLAPNAALRELGKIEAMIESAAKPAPKVDAVRPAAPKVEISAAPAPITPIRPTGIGEPEPKLDSAGNFKGTYAEWKSLRKAGKIK